MRWAELADHPQIETRLAQHPEATMFPMVNLREHGWDGDAPRAMRFLMAEDGGIVGITQEGMLMPLPGVDRLEGLGHALRGRQIMGAAGLRRDVRPVLLALELEGRQARLDSDETQYALDLADMVIPKDIGHLAPLSDDIELASAWRADYNVETLGETDEATAAAQAKAAVESFIERNSHAFLMVDGEAVAMTGLNAALPHIVQVGGVYTPPRFRRRGYAAQAVALQLRDCRDGGVMRATLFASSPTAGRVYEKLGFSRIGEYTLTIFANSEIITE